MLKHGQEGQIFRIEKLYKRHIAITQRFALDSAQNDMFVTAVLDTDIHPVRDPSKDRTGYQQIMHTSHIAPVLSGARALVAQAISRPSTDSTRPSNESRLSTEPMSTESKQESNQATKRAHTMLQNISNQAGELATLLQGNPVKSKLLEVEGNFNELQRDFQAVKRQTESLKQPKDELNTKMNALHGRIMELRHLLCADDYIVYDKSEYYQPAASNEILTSSQHHLASVLIFSNQSPNSACFSVLLAPWSWELVGEMVIS